uniref:NADH dehydrogenase subunit 4L n=1 Tax=Dipterophagus daci TaxID=2800156 RepID=UPI001D0F5582|nr:NADH dehydrogenase subunit 4L [Dipterophagus daci]QZO77421.1 NADH dehydrogenase subunit 4L [Dipterophagus daci]
MYYMVYLFIIMLIICIFLYSMNFLKLLLYIEMMMIYLFMYLHYYVSNIYDNYLLLIYLVFSVCDSILGLSLLISLSRLHNNDYLLMYMLY